MKNQTISRKRVFFVILAGFALIILVFSYQSILMEAGKYLAPGGIGKADVAVLEGAELIKEKPVKIGMGLLSSGMVSHLVVVVQQKSGEEQSFALSNYTRLLTKNLEGLGLKRDVFRVIEVPTNHPVTLTEAKIVLSDLSKSGVRSVILVAKDFHTRRSLWAYRQVGKPLGIEITPHPYFINYQNENWWQKARGIQNFMDESLKFLYYILRGYVPIKSLLVT
jgi:hypothetical protein